MTTTAPVLMNTADCAHLTGIPLRTIQRWIAAGRLANHGTPRRALIDMHELTQLAA